MHIEAFICSVRHLYDRYSYRPYNMYKTCTPYKDVQVLCPNESKYNYYVNYYVIIL